MSRAAVPMTLSTTQRRELESLARRRPRAQGRARRARLMLAAAEGLDHTAMVAPLSVEANTVGTGRRRVATQRPGGL